MTLCKFQVYILQDQQTHWVQCALPINIYIEKMYIIIWVWLWILLAFLVVDILCLLKLIISPNRFLINEIKGVVASDDPDFNKFKKHLKTDGALLLSLIKSNTNKYFVSILITKLYTDFRKTIN